MSNLFAAYIAGIFTTLSPCILPAIPLVVGGSLSSNKFGPVALAAGMTTSFTILGFIFAAFGFSIGLDESTVRSIAGLLFLVAGIFMVSKKAASLLSKVLNPIANKSNKIMSQFESDNLGGCFLIGALLGAVWSPCSGPTLGIAFALAAQTGTQGQAFVLFLLFGIGSATPLLLYAYGLRELFFKKRSEMFTASSKGKKIFGYMVILVGILVITGSDKTLETLIIDILPESIVNLSTKY